MTKKNTWWAMCVAGLVASAAGWVHAGPVLDRVTVSKVLKVCIWPDYYGISYRNPRTQELSGIDIDLAGELAKDIGARVQFVDSSFPSLIQDVKSDRCDIAMFAIGVLPQRAEHLRFAKPYLKSDIYGITTKTNAVVRQWSDIDQPGVLVGVQAGTFMEPVMMAQLKRARVVLIKPPETRERELEAGRIDVFMTDFPYSRRLMDSADWASLISSPTPFHVLPYAHAVKPGDDAWFSLVDGFVARIQKDGRLEQAAKKFGLQSIVVR